MLLLLLPDTGATGVLDTGFDGIDDAIDETGFDGLDEADDTAEDTGFDGFTEPDEAGFDGFTEPDEIGLLEPDGLREDTDPEPDGPPGPTGVVVGPPGPTGVVVGPVGLVRVFVVTALDVVYVMTTVVVCELLKVIVAVSVTVVPLPDVVMGPTGMVPPTLGHVLA